MKKVLFVVGAALAISAPITSCSSKQSNAKQSGSPQTSANTTQTSTGQSMQAQGPVSLSMMLTGMTPHIGQMLVFNIKDSANDSMVIDTGLASIMSDTFKVSFGPKLIKGQSYNIDFFADLNKNGKYDKPPVDHSWRIPLSKAMSDTTITFVHNTNFIDIGSPKIPQNLQKSQQTQQSGAQKSKGNKNQDKKKGKS
jgi:hypothetical protein